KTGEASTPPFTVQITQAAERATLTAASTLATSTTISTSNNNFTVTINGKTSSLLALAPGTYSQAALAQAIQSAINGDSTLLSPNVSVTVSGNALSITSPQYGLSSQVSMQSGTALADLGFTAGANSQGKDVVGNFLVNGVVETAVGAGQFLTGDSVNANT